MTTATRSTPRFSGTPRLLRNGTAPASQYVFTEDRMVTFPVYRYFPSLPDTERYGEFVNAQHKIFGDQMVVFSRSFFSNKPRSITRYRRRRHLIFKIPAWGAASRPWPFPRRCPGPTLGGPTYEELDYRRTPIIRLIHFRRSSAGSSPRAAFRAGLTESDSNVDSFFTTVGLRGKSSRTATGVTTRLSLQPDRRQRYFDPLLSICLSIGS